MEEQPFIRTVVFDLGGVILRTDNPRPRAELAQRMGITAAQLEHIVFQNALAQRAERGLASPTEVWEAICRELGLSEVAYPALRRDFFAGDTVDFELIQLIQQLRPHYCTALLSNTWIKELDAFIAQELHIPDSFDYIISSAALGLAKPDPALFNRMLEIVQSRPEETLFVDDNFENVTAASKLGIRTIRFFSTGQLQSDLRTFLRLSGPESAKS